MIFVNIIYDFIKKYILTKRKLCGILKQKNEDIDNDTNQNTVFTSTFKGI